MSNAPWWVGPSSPTSPARSIANTTFELLQADVVHDLVVGALQEGRVDRRHRLDALQREARWRTGPPAARRCRRRSSARASPSAGCSGPVPEFIAAVMPTTRSSRSHSRTSASPKTCVYCGGGRRRALGRGVRPPRGLVGEPLRIDFGLAACHFSMPSRPPSSAGREALALDRRDVHDDRAVRPRAPRAAPRAARCTSWPSITPM